MDRVRDTIFELRWDPARRLVSIRVDDSVANGERLDPRSALTVLAEWTGSDRQPFGTLADLKGLPKTSAQYRAKWADFFRERRDYGYLAVYHLDPFTRVLAEMFGRGIGLAMRIADSEDQARVWLRQRGIDV